MLIYPYYVMSLPVVAVLYLILFLFLVQHRSISSTVVHQNWTSEKVLMYLPVRPLFRLSYFSWLIYIPKPSTLRNFLGFR